MQSISSQDIIGAGTWTFLASMLLSLLFYRATHKNGYRNQENHMFPFFSLLSPIFSMVLAGLDPHSYFGFFAGLALSLIAYIVKVEKTKGDCWLLLGISLCMGITVILSPPPTIVIQNVWWAITGSAFTVSFIELINLRKK